MFCTRCGKDNPDDAAFCYKCGRQFEDEEETRVAKRGETAPATASAPIFSISPTIKFVLVGYLIAIIGAFFLVAFLSVFVPAVPPILAVVLGMILLIIPALYHIRKKLIRYTLTDAMIEIDRGLIARTTQNIPLRRVQDVTVTSTFFQRMLGYGDIMIDNASEDATKIILDDIDSPKKYAAMILERMRDTDR